MLLKIVCFLPHSVSWSYFKTGSECAAAIVHASRTLCMLGLAQGPKDYSWKLQKRLGAVLKKPGREQSPESCHAQRLSKLLRYRKLIFVDLITTSLHYKNGREVYDLSFGIYFLYTWCTRELCYLFGRTPNCRDSRINHIFRNTLPMRDN